MNNRIYFVFILLILVIFQSCKKDADKTEKEEEVSDTSKLETQVKNN